MTDEKSTATRNEQGKTDRYSGKNNGYVSSIRSLFWALAFIVLGGLLFAQALGWLAGDVWFPYFLIGLGGICLLDVLVFSLHPSYHHFSFGRFSVGIILIFIGASIVTGFEYWLPLVLILVGLAIFAAFSIKRTNSSVF
jgi:hypothetical protein